MKKIIYLLAYACIFASCSEKKENATETAATETSTTETSAKVEMMKPDYGYPVRYSEWEIGNPENIKTVMNLYKAWDAKDAGKVASLFADTVKLRLPTEREEIVISNDKVNEALGKNRSMYDSTSNNIISAVSLHDRESNEDWVMITTYNKWIEKNGKRDSLLYHDNWQLKDGKISFLMSFYKLPSDSFIKKNDPKK
jgi:ketosteroid isomerase-like protein